MSNVSKNDYEKIVKLYNESGNQAAMEYIQQNYGIKSPRGVLMRIKKAPGYSYDSENNKIIKGDEKEEPVFMGIDELCNQSTSKKNKPSGNTSSYTTKDVTLDSIYKDLMQEKLMELTKYIKLIRHSSMIYIDKTALKADGYQITIQ